MGFTIAPKFSNNFYAIRNAPSTTERNDLMRRAARQGMATADLATAAKVAPSTARKVLTSTR